MFYLITGGNTWVIYEMASLLKQLWLQNSLTEKLLYFFMIVLEMMVFITLYTVTRSSFAALLFCQIILLRWRICIDRFICARQRFITTITSGILFSLKFEIYNWSKHILYITIFMKYHIRIWWIEYKKTRIKILNHVICFLNHEILWRIILRKLFSTKTFWDENCLICIVFLIRYS